MTKLALLTAILALGACKWTQFDDQETEAWVHSTTKPNSDSNDYGIAMIRSGSGTDPTGDRLVVLGSGQPLFSELNYTPDGNADLVSSNKLTADYGITSFDPVQPILVHQPTTNEVSLVANSGGGSIVIIGGVHMLAERQIFNPESASPDAAAYVTAPTSPTPSPLLVVAAMESVYGSPNVPGVPASVCRLVDTDGTTAVPVIALGGARTVASATTDDIVVWAANGKLYLYPTGVATADPATCIVPTPPPTLPGVATPIAGSMPVDTGFKPTKTSQMHILDGRFAVLVGHLSDSAVTSQIMLYDLQANAGLMPALVGTPVTRPGQRSSTILTVDASHRYVAAGYDKESIDGTPQAGQVILYAITPTGIDSNPAETLNDAQPEANELFGRSVASFTFNGHEILAVGAANEVFAYYHTQLYGEARAQ